jgi:hypothetical protein
MRLLVLAVLEGDRKVARVVANLAIDLVARSANYLRDLG